MSSDRTGASDPVIGDLVETRTQEVHVRAFVRNGAVIEGDAHVSPGGYQGRVSDVLNRGNMRYLPITEAHYTAADGDVPRRSECVLVNVQDLVMLDVSPDQGSDAPVT